MKITDLTNEPLLIEGQSQLADQNDKDNFNRAKQESTKAPPETKQVDTSEWKNDGRHTQPFIDAAGKSSGGYHAARCGYADAYLAAPKTK
jgi:hypothetical protein